MIKRIQARLEGLSEHQFVIGLVIIGLLVGIVAIKSNGTYRIAPDSIGYHNYAVNILERGVYSVQSDSPYLEHFVREPGYPLFLALIYKSYSLLAKPSLITEIQYDSVNRRITTHKPEIEYAKYIHLLLLIIAVYFLYLSIRMFSTLFVSRLFGLAALLYYPYTMFCVYLMRETLIGLFLALFTYSLVRFYKSNNQWFLLLATVVIGLASLTWQVMIAFTPLIMIAMLVNKHHVHKSIMWTCLYACVFVSVMSPWLFYVYAYYPDIRILKSGGTSLTHEVQGYISVLLEADYHGTLSSDEFWTHINTETYKLPSEEVFRRSFSGWYKNAADSLKAYMSISKIDHYKYILFSNGGKFKNLMVQNRWTPFIQNTRGGIDPSRALLSLLLNGISVFVGIFSILGLLLFPRRNLIMVLPYLLYGALFIVIGSESRRFIPLVPFMVFMNIIAINWIFNKLVGWGKCGFLTA